MNEGYFKGLKTFTVFIGIRKTKIGPLFEVLNNPKMTPNPREGEAFNNDQNNG